MSISRCPYCDTQYDQDFEVEHEEECKAEQQLYQQAEDNYLNYYNQDGDN